MINGLYFYKLISPYPEDVTKNCKLTVNEIDSNFLNLKDMQIERMDFDVDTYILTLTRKNGDVLQSDLSPMVSGITRDFSISFDEPTGTLTVRYNGNVDEIGGIITKDNLGDYVLTEAISDGSIIGDGTDSAPLGLNPVEKTGFYRPVIDLIDTIAGETLPECNNNGDRYLTIEEVDDYGHLYNYSGVTEIIRLLNNGWRVPTKADWDSMLNAIEPCEYRNHDSLECHVELGKYAGLKLKSVNDWISAETDGSSDGTETDPAHSKCGYSGIDEYGFGVLPGGYGISKRKALIDFGEGATFWSSTQTMPGMRSDYYTKTFYYDSSGVWQAAECPDNFYSLRLIKDYTGSNARETEYIAGKYYPTVLLPTMKGDSKHGYAIWTSVNVDLGLNEGVSEENYIKYEDYGEEYPTLKQKVYIINHWTGKNWERKRMIEGDTIVINEKVTIEDLEGNLHEYDNNTEFRLVYIDGEYRLVATSDIIYEQVIANIQDDLDALSGAIETEKEERELDVAELWDAIGGGGTGGSIADDIRFLSGAIDTEKEEREFNDESISAAVDTYVSGINESIDNLVEETENIWDAIEEISGSTEHDYEELLHMIEDETTARTAADDVLTESIAEEVAARETLEGKVLVGGTYVMSIKDGIEIPSVDGQNNVILEIDGDFGTL